MPDQSKHLCSKTSNETRQLKAIRCVSVGGKVLCMHIITIGKTARSRAYIQSGCLLHDALYQDHSEKRSRLERLLSISSGSLLKRQAVCVNNIT